MFIQWLFINDTQQRFSRKQSSCQFHWLSLTMIVKYLQPINVSIQNSMVQLSQTWCNYRKHGAIIANMDAAQKLINALGINSNHQSVLNCQGKTPIPFQLISHEGIPLLLIPFKFLVLTEFAKLVRWPKEIFPKQTEKTVITVFIAQIC